MCGKEAVCPSHRFKHIHRIRKNAWSLLRRSKRDRALFVTLTLEDEGDGQPDSLEAERRLNEARGLLDELFEEWFFVMEFCPEAGLPHFHGIGIARENVTGGWRHEPFQEIGKLRRRARSAQRELTPDEGEQVRAWGRAVTPNKNLREIWDRLREKLPALGFGARHPAHSTPIRKWNDCVAYLVKDQKTPSKEWKRYWRGTKLFHHSSSFKISCTTDFSWNSKKTRLARKRMSRIAAALRVSPERCETLIGKPWLWRMNKLIGELNRLGIGWLHNDDRVVEAQIIAAFETIGSGWATTLAAELRERRVRHDQGLSEDFEPQPPPSILDDIKWANEQHKGRSCEFSP